MAKEILLDQGYGKARIDSLLSTGRSVRSVVFWVGLLSITVAWAVVFFQNLWLGIEVKKRM